MPSTGPILEQDRDAGRATGLSSCRFNEVVTGSERAGGVGHAGISDDMKRLATTASEVSGAALTGPARIGQPILATESVESR